MQQVFIRLWEKRESIDESVDLDGYLFIITRNMIFNRSRRSFNEKAYKEVMEAIGSDSYTLDAPPLSYRLSEANGDVPTGYTKKPGFNLDPKYGAVRSKDMITWEDVSDRMTFPQGMRHGTVFKVSRKIFNRMASER